MRKKDWFRKSEKRQRKRKDRGIVDLVKLIRHFFSELPQWINGMADGRDPSYIVYTQADLVLMGVMKNICGVESMCSMEENFNEEECIRTLRILSGDAGMEEMPHKDTLNYYLSMLSPECLSGVRTRMVKSLIRMKSFGRARLLGKYWRVILDGTGLFSFKEKHCDNCLTSTVTLEDGTKRKIYHHKVLEAKLVLSDGIVVSIGTEFIENESEDVSKQDCETNAAKRLIARLKEEYPRLPVCIQGDGLYETEPMMRLCRENGWRYIFTHKEGMQKLADESYRLFDGESGKKTRKGICGERGEGKYVNHVEKTVGKEEIMNMYEYSYEDGRGERHTFEYVTDIELTTEDLEEMCCAGRGRWDIENKGFNNQKNGIYKIEHMNSRNGKAMKNHYLLTQIADIIMQIYLAWTPLIKEVKQSIKNTSSRLLESFRRQTITGEDVSYIERHTTVYLE